MQNASGPSPVLWMLPVLNWEDAFDSASSTSILMDAVTERTKPNLTFKQQDWYLNFSIRFKKNVLFEQEQIQLWNKWHFVENKTVIMQHVLKIQYISLLPKYIKWVSRGVLHVFAYAKVPCTHSNGICHTGYAVSITCMTYTIAFYTVLDSWWWTEKLSETCRVPFQK